MKLTRVSTLPRAFLGALSLVIATSGCYDFNTVGPEDPPPLQVPATVPVTVVYNRPSECINVRSSCAGPVQFTASWMAIGSSVVLQQSTAHTWVATIPNVPVNYPGTDPHRVYAVDPFLFDSPTAGVSADRLVVGGQVILDFDDAGNSREKGLIFIDSNGKGRRP